MGSRRPHSATPALSVLRPRLPTAERLLPYLRRIDATRIYTNWGPLAGELAGRLADSLRLPAGGVTTASSGTAGLVGATLASAGRASPERPLALLPAFTFVATAVAVQQCGYEPYLCDIDDDNWTLDPEAIAEHPMLDQAGVVLPVAPFGRPVSQAGWESFRERTGIPVVIDGAASFDRLVDDPEGLLGEIPVVVSFHATKCFSTGEGGCVAATDPDLVLRVGQALNFGFHETRESRLASVNGKLSEYHAAIGLAELDGWDEKRDALAGVTGSYRRHLAGTALADRLVAAPEIGSSYVLFHARDEAEARRVEDGLARANIDYRRWYGAGLHRHAAFAACPRDDLSSTEELVPRLIGIPLAPDLDDTTVAHVVGALAEAV